MPASEKFTFDQAGMLFSATAKDLEAILLHRLLPLLV